LAWVQGDYGDAVTLAEHGLALRRSQADAAGIAFSLNVLGLVALDQGDIARSGAMLEESLALRRTLNDAWGIAISLNNLGMVARNKGEFARAVLLHEEGLTLQRAHGDVAGMAISLKNLGLVASALGDYAKALAYFGESVSLYNGVGDSVGVAQALDGAAEVAPATSGQPMFKNEVAQALEGAAGVANLLGQPAEAARLLGAAAFLRDEIGAPISPAERADIERTVDALKLALQGSFLSTWSSGVGEAPEKLIASVARLVSQVSPNDQS
jgi:tetratricopeptide (TPR) repeat protein